MVNDCGSRWEANVISLQESGRDYTRKLPTNIDYIFKPTMYVVILYLSFSCVNQRIGYIFEPTTYITFFGC